jgi:hypothetical protein
MKYMVKVIIPQASITHIAAAKTLTLAAPYNLIDMGQILEIRDLNINSLFWYYLNPRRNNNPNGALDISLSGGVITYTENSTGRANGDFIQILVDLPLSIDGGTP